MTQLSVRTPISDMERMAAAIAKSGLFGIRQPEQALALMLVAEAEGLHPGVAARDYHVINGQPALKADAILSRFLAAGGKVEWHEYTDAVVSATFSHPAGGSVRVDWDNDRIKQAGLSGNHRKYPRQMKRARCISEGVRTVYPVACGGVCTPEEVSDFAPRQQPASSGSARVIDADVSPAAKPAPEVISDDQVETLQRMLAVIDASPEDAEKLAAWVGAETLWDIPTTRYEACVEVLRKKAAKLEAETAEPEPVEQDA